MGKKIIIPSITLVIISILYLAVNTNMNNKYVNEKSGYSNFKLDSDVEKQKIPISEIGDDLLEAKNKIENNDYPNLYGESIRIYEGAEGPISKLHLLLLEGKDFLSFEEQMKIIESTMPNINYDYVVDMYTGKGYEQVKKEIEAGTYINERVKNDMEKGIEIYDEEWIKSPGMCYMPEKYTEGYAMIEPIIQGSFIEKGKYYSLKPTYSEKILDNIDWVNTYYYDGENLDDRYQLYNGSISVKEAMEFAEYYMKNELLYDTEEAFDVRTEFIKVYKINENLYSFRQYMCREYNGIYFESGPQFGNQDGIYFKEAMNAYMVDIDDIDMYGPEINAHRVEKTGKEYDKILPATSAVEIVAGHIGQASGYDISSIELVYRKELIDDGKDCYVVPNWRLRGFNANDDFELFFYVNVFDGSLSIGSPKFA